MTRCTRPPGGSMAPEDRVTPVRGCLRHRRGRLLRLAQRQACRMNPRRTTACHGCHGCHGCVALIVSACEGCPPSTLHQHSNGRNRRCVACRCSTMCTQAQGTEANGLVTCSCHLSGLHSCVFYALCTHVASLVRLELFCSSTRCGSKTPTRIAVNSLTKPDTPRNETLCKTKSKRFIDEGMPRPATPNYRVTP